jgi:hypothetical protein
LRWDIARVEFRVPNLAKSRLRTVYKAGKKAQKRLRVRRPRSLPTLTATHDLVLRGLCVLVGAAVLARPVYGVGFTRALVCT